MPNAFDYSTAFSRNIGWFSHEEQETLRTKHVAIAGLGGVGGGHLLTLARLGIGRFTLADFDTFDLANFNRQAGATMSSLGQPKLDVLVRMVRDINPEVDLRLFPGGANPDKMDDFLEQVDIYIDSLDFFAFEARRAVFAACNKLGIPSVTAAPLGMTAAVLVFVPGQMSFEEYFRLEGCSEDEMALRFLLGLAPGMLHSEHLIDPRAIDLPNRRGPSTIIACQLCSGLAATEAVKLLLHRGPIRAAPNAYQFDAYSGRIYNSCIENGNANPEQIQRIRELKKAMGIK